MTEEIWKRVQARLKFRLGDGTYNSWFRMMKLDEVAGNHVVLSTPTRFMRDWVLSHYTDDLLACWQEEDASVAVVDVIIKAATVEEATPAAITEGHERAISKAAIHTSAQEGDEDFGSKLDARYTFDSFVVGPSNELAHAAARSIATSAQAVAGSNPLFLYGGVGLGKTHLMHAMALHIRKVNPERRVCYMSAEKFMYLYVRALQTKNMISFKERIRSVDVLLVDDVQFICGKDNTQEEFFHTFNELIDSGRQVVISADRSPSDLNGLEERIRSRLGWGLVADINTTTFELRLGILQSKVESMKLPVPQDVLEFLASRISSNVRELEGALNKVVAHSTLTSRAITLESTQAILCDLLRASERSVTIEEIQRRVSEHCNIRLAEMHSARRARHIARPRQLAMYLSKKLTTHSLPEIGRKFGGKDHTTVMHAVKRIESLYDTDRDMRNDVDLLTRMLQS